MRLFQTITPSVLYTLFVRCLLDYFPSDTCVAFKRMRFIRCECVQCTNACDMRRFSGSPLNMSISEWTGLASHTYVSSSTVITLPRISALRFYFESQSACIIHLFFLASSLLRRSMQQQSFRLYFIFCVGHFIENLMPIWINAAIKRLKFSVLERLGNLWNFLLFRQTFEFESLLNYSIFTHAELYTSA